MLCNPAQKTVVKPTQGQQGAKPEPAPLLFPQAHLACYQVEPLDEKAGEGIAVRIRDQFEGTDVKVLYAALLCVPATKKE